jgi:hypothetical protein
MNGHSLPTVDPLDVMLLNAAAASEGLLDPSKVDPFLDRPSEGKTEDEIRPIENVSPELAI